MAKARAKDIETAARAVQLYIGCNSDPRARQSDVTRLYQRAERLVASVARKRGLNVNNVRDAIWAEASKRGGICPLPGKDI